MGKLSGHPHVVDILQSGVTPSGRPYIVMPYHPRDSLEAWVRHEGPLPWAEVLRVGVKLAGALETAHRAGTLHRDVKPANILLTGYGEPQLTDFGIARVSGGFETTSSMITGSPAYTAPEVLRGEPPSVASDVYSLGAALFCLLTGHAAFERRSSERLVAQFLRIATQPVPDLRGKTFRTTCAPRSNMPWPTIRPIVPRAQRISAENCRRRNAGTISASTRWHCPRRSANSRVWNSRQPRPLSRPCPDAAAVIAGARAPHPQRRGSLPSADADAVAGAADPAARDASTRAPPTSGVDPRTRRVREEHGRRAVA